MNHPDPRGADRSPSADAPAEPALLASASFLLLPGGTDREFEAQSAAWLSRFDAADLIARLLAESLLAAAQRLRRASQLEPDDGIPGLDWCRYQALAERNFRSAFRDLRRHLLDAEAAASPPPAQARAAKAKPKRDAAPAPASAAERPPAAPESTPEEIAEAAANWRRHIALVRSVSEEWPILLRLGREVEDVAAWLGDGTTEAELMAWYPGLTRADIAACRACDAEGLCGPFDPADGPYPPGLPVLDDLPDEDSGP